MAIGTKWVFKNKKDERGIVIRNKARLVAQGHRQEEGIDYEEVFAHVARIEAIRLFLAYASFMGFLVYQVDVKSAFLYGTIEEEVYVTQPPGFKDPGYPDKVYKVVKAFYGLHQAPRAWYESLANYLLGNGFKRGKIDQTLFIKKQKGHIFLVQVYVDDIIFGSTNKDLCTGFEKLIKDKFQMSYMRELTFFLGLQVQQKEDGIFISQDKYVAEILKKFNYTDVKSASTLVDLEKPLVKDGDADDVDVHSYRLCLGLWYSRDSPFELVAYTDSDYAGATQDRKSTTGGCQFLGNMLISWQCKKQIVVATSTTEAEYVAAANLLTKGFDAGRLCINMDPHEFSHVYLVFSSVLVMNRENYYCQAKVNAAEGDSINTSIQETSIRSDLHLEDAGGTDCLPIATIFKELARMGSQKKQSRRKQRKDTVVTQEEPQQDVSVPKPSNDPPISEKAKDAQAKEIADLKKRVQKLERKKKSRTTGLKRLRKVGMSGRVESSEDKDIDDTQGRSDDADMFDTNDLHGDEVNVDMPVGEKQEQSAKEREVDTSVEDTKPKVVTTAATTTTTRPKARGVVVQEPGEFRTPQESQPSMIKDKGKAIMIEPKVPLKRKYQVALDEDLARNLQAQLEAELIEEERITMK
ncbi:putative ribonuclease H-like domain-containing protein [Tanacetum coccineum]